MTERFQELEVLFFAGQPDWEAWLAVHHDRPAGVWLKFAKKASGITSLSYAPALDVALCYGWIDGQVQSLDETYYLQKFTPRRPKSLWSKRNIDKVASLTEAGKMQPAGLAAVAAAQADGRWAQAYDSPKNMTLPDDFAAELAKHPKAQAAYEKLSKTNTYSILWALQTAKKPETRQARMQKFITQLSGGEKPQQQQ